jgi:hypothetical protein
MANSVSSRTSPVEGTVVTHKPKFKEGTHLLLKYAKGNGTKVSIKIVMVFPFLDVADEYQQIYLNDPVTPAVQTYEFSASGNYHIPIALPQGCQTIKATVTFTDGDTQVAVVDFRDE